MVVRSPFISGIIAYFRKAVKQFAAVNGNKIGIINGAVSSEGWVVCACSGGSCFRNGPHTSHGTESAYGRLTGCPRATYSLFQRLI
jgi:hypothetical protein